LGEGLITRLWAVFAVMLASAIGVTIWSQMLPKGQRVFHQLGVIILGMLFLLYLKPFANEQSLPL
jgi:hypothetical protein